MAPGDFSGSYFLGARAAPDSAVGDGDGLYREQWNLSGDRRLSIVLRD